MSKNMETLNLFNKNIGMALKQLDSWKYWYGFLFFFISLPYCGDKNE